MYLENKIFKQILRLLLHKGLICETLKKLQTIFDNIEYPSYLSNNLISFNREP